MKNIPKRCKRRTMFMEIRKDTYDWRPMWKTLLMTNSNQKLIQTSFERRFFQG